MNERNYIFKTNIAAKNFSFDQQIYHLIDTSNLKMKIYFQSHILFHVKIEYYISIVSRHDEVGAVMIRKLLHYFSLENKLFFVTNFSKKKLKENFFFSL